MIEKKFKVEIDFIVLIKLTTTMGGGEEKNSKRNFRVSKNIRIINVFLESLLSASLPLKGVTVHLASLG